MGRDNFHPIVALNILLLLVLVACQPEPFDPYVLNEQAGQMEVVIPAEHYITQADVSPGGTWLVYDYLASDNKTYMSLLNIPENRLYDKLIPGGISGRWLDDDHMAFGPHVLQLSTMTLTRKEFVTLSSVEEWQEWLKERHDLFFVGHTNSDPMIFSTDTDYLYTILFEPADLGCTAGTSRIECAKAMLTEEQIASLIDVPDSNARRMVDEPIYSPNGQYYVDRGHYPDDPTHNLGGAGAQLFRTGESTPVVYGHRYGWVASFRGWAPDSSGAYILYRPRSAAGDLLRSQYPIRKYLVPGAEPRGAPTLVDPLPIISGLEEVQPSGSSR